MAAVTASEVKSALAPVLKLDEAEMPAYWDGICEHAADFAFWQVRDALLSRGFRLTEDVVPWDRLHEFTRDLALWKALNLGGAYDVVPKDTRDALDRREELETVLVYVGGLWVRPAGDMPGQAASAGPTVAQNSGVFPFSDDPDDWDHGIQV